MSAGGKRRQWGAVIAEALVILYLWVIATSALASGALAIVRQVLS